MKAHRGKYAEDGSEFACGYGENGGEVGRPARAGRVTLRPPSRRTLTGGNPMSVHDPHDRRRFLRTAVAAVAAELGMLTPRPGRSPPDRRCRPRSPPQGTHAWFGSLKQVEAGVTSTSASPRPVPPRPAPSPAAWLALRHPQLRRRRPAAGRCRPPRDRALPARLRHDALPLGGTPRNGQQAAFARDAIALMDALGIEQATSPASTGVRARPRSWRRSGPSAARRWSRSAAT